MDTLNFSPSGNEEDHINLRDFFKDHQRPDVSRQLTQLRQWRNKSDYENPSYVINESQTRRAIQQAESLIQSMNT